MLRLVSRLFLLLVLLSSSGTLPVQATATAEQGSSSARPQARLHADDAGDIPDDAPAARGQSNVGPEGQTTSESVKVGSIRLGTRFSSASCQSTGGTNP